MKFMRGNEANTGWPPCEPLPGARRPSAEREPSGTASEPKPSTPLGGASRAQRRRREHGVGWAPLSLLLACAHFGLLVSCGSGFSSISGTDASDEERSDVIVIEATLPDAESDHIDRDARAQDARDERDAHADTGPAPCDTTDTPKDNPCVITDALGVFVAPEASGGNDTTGTGTRSQPYATLGMGIASAVTAGKRVYACGATYPESLVVSIAMDGVEVYGGLECPTAGGAGAADAGTADSGSGPWSYNGTPAAVAPTATGYALDVENLTKGALFEDMAFTALDANPANAGESSIGVMVNGSQKVSFVRVSATVGSGSMGALGGALATNMCATSLGEAPQPAAEVETKVPAPARSLELRRAAREGAQD
jgi:hypothetical protein